MQFARNAALLFAVVVGTLHGPGALAGDVFWDGTVDDFWTTDANWSAGNEPLVGDRAIFDTVSVNPLVILPASRTIDAMTIEGVTGSGPHVFQRQNPAVLTVTNGLQLINDASADFDGFAISVGSGSIQSGSSLTLSNGANLMSSGGVDVFGTLNWNSGSLATAAGTALNVNGGTMSVSAGGRGLGDGVSLNVTNGGKFMSSEYFDIGSSFDAGNGPVGTLLVSGNGSSYVLGGGFAPFWSFNAGDSAHVTFSNQATGTLGAGVAIARNGGTASVNILSGASLFVGDQMNVSSTVAGSAATITVNGGTLTSAGGAAFFPGARLDLLAGRVTFNNDATFSTGSTFNVTGSGVVSLGGNSTFSTGSSFNSATSGPLFIGSGRTLAFDGGIGTVSALFNGVQDGQTLRVTNGGQLTVVGGLHVALVGDGTLFVDGPNSKVVSANTNTMTWGQAGFATVTISNGGAGTYNGGMQLASVGQALVNINSGGLLHIQSVATTFNGGTATINVNGGTLRTMQNFGLNGGATLNYAAGTVHVGGTLNTTGDARLLMTSGADKVLRVGGLNMEGTSTIDLADNDMIIDYTGSSPLTSIRDKIASAYASGAWTGSGLGTSMGNSSQFGLGYAEAAAIFSSFPATYAGQQVDDTSVLIGFTRYGDANLDGTVNLSDFNALASSFGQSGKFWFNGDFNYDGVVNLADFNLLAANFGLSASGPGVTPEDWATLAAAVPEPTALGLATFVATGLLAPRRRRQS